MEILSRDELLNALNGTILPISLTLLLACNSNRTEPAAPTLLGSGAQPMQWTGDDPGWTAGFADYPAGVEQAWHFESGVRPVPAPLTASHRALFIAGDNHSDDLFMFWKRSVTSLDPGQAYDATFTVTFATDAPKSCSGVGGAPGESVFVKVGASTTEPTVGTDHAGNVAISIKKGNQGNDGKEVIVVGNAATSNTDCRTRRWEQKQLHSKSALRVVADNKGAIWILIGTDSGYEARSELYYASVALDLKPVGAAASAMEVSLADSIKPEPFPDPKIPDFHFPEPEATVEGWSTKNDQPAMAKHAWGIWTALTADSGQTFHGEALRVYETWSTPQDLLAGDKTLGMRSPNPRPLGELRQFRHEHNKQLLLDHGDDTVTGFVKFDPSAVAFITANDLLSTQKLETFLPAGKIPDLPNTAIALKAQYVTASTSKGRYFRLANFPGPPSPAKAFPSSQWKQCVWIDLQDPSAGLGTGVDTKCAADGSSRTDANTFGLGRFIHFTMSASDAEARNAFVMSLETVTGDATLAKAGDIAILVGMHVTTREITRWSWATFWWSPTPDVPTLPSSKETAAQRPSQLTGAARSYATCVANMMESPPQPNTGGQNRGESVYCYNPWLEAGFGPSILPDSEDGNYQGKKVANNVGVQTNCMSCHAAAHFNPNNVPNTPRYTGDRYVDLASARFNGTVKVDFLWSISDFAH